MHIVHVFIRVLPGMENAFIAASKENARNSVQEPGVARFDFIREKEDPTRFVLVEVYRSPEAAASHKDTAHYKTWRDAVAGMMAEPRKGVVYSNLSPDDKGWG